MQHNASAPLECGYVLVLYWRKGPQKYIVLIGRLLKYYEIFWINVDVNLQKIVILDYAITIYFPQYLFDFCKNANSNEISIDSEREMSVVRYQWLPGHWSYGEFPTK